MLPSVFEDLERMRARLVELTSLSASAREAPAAMAEAEALYAEVDGLGFVLGTVGAACGANLFLARRVGRGLQHVALAVGGVLARHRVALMPCPDELPGLRPAVGEGWELPLLFGALVHAAGLDAPGELRWHLQVKGGRASLGVSPGAEAPESVGAAARALAESSLPELSLEGSDLRFPTAWLEEEAGVSHERP